MTTGEKPVLFSFVLFHVASGPLILLHTMTSKCIQLLRLLQPCFFSLPPSALVAATNELQWRGTGPTQPETFITVGLASARHEESTVSIR